MSLYFRYAFVAMTGLLLILGPFGWALQFKQSFRAKYARLLREADIAQGKPASNLSDAELIASGFGAELPPEEVTQLWLCDLLFKFWWAWALLVIGMCCGLLLILGWLLPVTHRSPEPVKPNP